MNPEAKEILELYIITYNRSVHLDNTLRQLVGCPFAGFPITILDNCSEDDTKSVFLNYQNQFPNLSYIRNKINIGADANVLRAAELSSGLYTWILCDDDNYDFSICDDVLAELNKGEAAAIMVGWSDEFVWPRGGMYGTPSDMLRHNFPYFSVPTFTPGSIFKTNLFQAQIRISYTNVVNLLPLMTYYIRLYEENNIVYISKSKLVSAMGQGGYHYSFVRVMNAVLNTFYLINNHKVRQQAFYSSYLNPPVTNLIKQTLHIFKSNGAMPMYSKYRYLNTLKWIHKVLFLLIYCLAPLINLLTLLVKKLR